MMLTDEQLATVFAERFTHTAFRLERQPAYEVPSDHLDDDPAQVSDYDRWLAGAEEPLWERKEPYLEVLRGERAALRYRYRVRIRRDHPYEDYECAFGYVPNFQAGEDIFVLDLRERPEPPPVVDHDFWLLDDQTVIRMSYADTGEYEGAELIEDDQRVQVYRAARDAAMGAAVPFTAWWARHPELHRGGRRAAA
jgi:hypothetical protein